MTRRVFLTECLFVRRSGRRISRRSPAGERNSSMLSEISQPGHKTLGQVWYGSEMHHHAQNTFLTTISFWDFCHSSKTNFRAAAPIIKIYFLKPKRQ